MDQIMESTWIAVNPMAEASAPPWAMVQVPPSGDDGAVVALETGGQLTVCQVGEVVNNIFGYCLCLACRCHLKELLRLFNVRRLPLPQQQPATSNLNRQHRQVSGEYREAVYRPHRRKNRRQTRQRSAKTCRPPQRSWTGRSPWRNFAPRLRKAMVGETRPVALMAIRPPLSRRVGNNLVEHQP